MTETSNSDEKPSDGFSSDDVVSGDLKTLRRHDLVVSLVLWALTFFIFLDSLRMTFNVELPGVESSVWLVAPGLLPLVLSGGLLLMFTALIVLSLKQGRFQGHFTRTAIGKAVTDRETLTKILQMLLLCIYVFGLIGRMPFGVASAIYLFSAMMIARAAKLWQIALISLLFAAAVSYVFGTLMKIPLP